MFKFKMIFSVLAFAFLTSACASSHMKEITEQQALSKVTADKSTMVFFRSSSFGGAVQSTVYDTTDGKTDFIGIISATKKMAHVTEPGKHQFMVIGENASFLEANMLPGKTYYARVSPRMGLWKARFVLEPVPVREEGMEEEVNSCTWTEPLPSAFTWAKENDASIKARQAEYFADWEKSDKKLYLMAEDGK